MVVLKNCEPEISHIVAELFSKCVKKPCFPDQIVGRFRPQSINCLVRISHLPQVRIKKYNIFRGRKNEILTTADMWL